MTNNISEKLELILSRYKHGIFSIQQAKGRILAIMLDTELNKNKGK